MLCLAAAALIVVLDQIVKHLTLANIPLGGRVDFLPGIMDLTYVRNTGASFSMLSGNNWLLAIITALAVIVMFVLILAKKVRAPILVWSMTAVAGGAVGNLIDRLRFGYVVDMFEVTFVRFAVFNVADCFITVGGIILCAYLLFDSIKEAREEKKAKQDGTDDTP